MFWKFFHNLQNCILDFLNETVSFWTCVRLRFVWVLFEGCLRAVWGLFEARSRVFWGSFEDRLRVVWRFFPNLLMFFHLPFTELSPAALQSFKKSFSFHVLLMVVSQLFVLGFDYLMSDDVVQLSICFAYTGWTKIQNISVGFSIISKNL